MEGRWRVSGRRQREWFQFERNSSWWWRRRSTGREESWSPIGGDEMKLKNVLNNLNKTVSWFKVMLFFFLISVLCPSVLTHWSHLTPCPPHHLRVKHFDKWIFTGGRGRSLGGA